MRHRPIQRIQAQQAPSAATGPREQGQQMVEFTFTFAMLCVFFAALLMLGWVFYSYVTIVNAARDGSYHIWTHADGHPDDPDTFGEFGAEAEAISIMTSTASLLDWRNMEITISPEREEWVPGGWIAVEIVYTVNLPTFTIPLGFDDTTFTLLRPIQLVGRSVRSLD